MRLLLAVVFVFLAIPARAPVMLSVSSIQFGLAGRWTFDENAGTTANDISGNANTGTLGGGTLPNWTTGHHGYALNFDGLSGYVGCGNGASLRPTNITIASWCYITNNGTAAGCNIVTRWKDPGQAGYVLKTLSTTRRIRFIFSSDGSYNPANDTTSSGAIALNEWHHVAETFDGTQSIAYIDGVADHTNLTAASSIFASTASVYLGADVDAATAYFPGILDDVRVYNRALPALEVYNLFSQ